MSKFTPGKWSVGIHEKYGQYIYADDGEAIIAVIRSCGYTGHSEEKEAARQANAQLIAAAPEMYELLKALAYPNGSDSTTKAAVRLRARKLLVSIDSITE